MTEYPKFLENFTCAGDRCLEYYCPGEAEGTAEADHVRTVSDYPYSEHKIGDYLQKDLSLSCMEVGNLFFAPGLDMTTVSSEPGSTGDELLDMYRMLRDQLVATALDPNSPLDDLFAIEETPNELWELMDSLEVQTEDWAKAVHAVKLLLSRPDYHSAELLFKEQQADQLERWFRKLGAYFFFRYTLDAYRDGDLSMERVLTLRSLKFLYLMCFARWSKRGHPVTVYDMIDLAHVFSNNIERSPKNLTILKNS